MMHDLLFELGTEELPSGAVLMLAEGLANQLVARLATAHIHHEEVHFFATPRRLAVLIKAVEGMQAEQAISRRGPAFAAGQDKDGMPTQALIGFAKSCGVDVDALTTVETDKGKWWLYECIAPGAKTRDLLPTMFNEVLAALPVAKPMRWGDGDTEFARPVHWAVLLFGDDVIECDALGVKTGRQSYGHRFHHPESIDISTPAAYESTLHTASVIADFTKRRQQIMEQVQSLASSMGFVAEMPENLVDEVTSIVEWPVALLVHFDEQFLDVPAEALIASMQSHQKCFALRNAAGVLVPHFITVSNISSTCPEQVIAGNEKVMRARLSDAEFFYQKDRQQPLNAYREDTAKVLFQAKLGSLLDKSERLRTLMSDWIESMQLPREDALRAAELSKCDLMTGMVGEFPELQGLMGYYYARHSGEAEAVAVALNEQYMPRFAADVLPASDLGRALSLADRLDTLVGAFAIGQRPTGVKDPFKLRRHALAVIRLLIQIPHAPALSVLIDQALQAYGDTLNPEAGSMEALRLFILERLYAYYESQAITADLVQAVRASQDDVLFDMDKRLKALNVFVSRQEAQSLSAACKRVNNLLNHADAAHRHMDVQATLFQEAAEQELFRRVEELESLVASHYVAHQYEEILTHLASLREPVDAFFEHVMVMVDDEAQRNNRLSLLARLQSLLQGVADISLLGI